MAFISKAVLLGIRVTRKIALRSGIPFRSDPVTFILYIRLLLHPAHRLVHHRRVFFSSVRKASVRNEIVGICLLCGRRTDHCSRSRISLFIEWNDKKAISRVKRRNRGGVGSLLAPRKRQQALSCDQQDGFLQNKDLSSIATVDDSISFSFPQKIRAY